MMLVILWCFILANVKIINGLNYDGTQSRIYPRLDFTCLNSTFSVEFNLNSNQNQNQTRLLVYQDQNGKMKYFLLKLIKQHLVFSDHWNQNVEIPIDISVNQWYKFIYRRKTPIGTAELLLQQLNNKQNLFTNLYQKELTADLSKFGLIHSDYSYLWVGGPVKMPTDKSLTLREVLNYNNFNGQIRNLFYSSVDFALQNKQQQQAAVASTCDCEQLPRRQYALFNRYVDNRDACEYDFNKYKLCTRDCTCMSTTIDTYNNNDFKCDCSQKTSTYCKSIDKSFKSYQINFNDDKFNSNEINYSLLPSSSSLMSVKLSDAKWDSNNGLEFQVPNSFVSFKQGSNIKDIDACFWNIDKCPNGFTQYLDIFIRSLEPSKINEKIVIFRNGQPNKLSTLTSYLHKNRLYFSLFNYADNKEWLVYVSISDYLKQNINDLNAIITWDNAKLSLTLHVNGILSDYAANPLNRALNNELALNNQQNYIYQIGLISNDKIKSQQTHQFQIRSIRRDYYENTLSESSTEKTKSSLILLMNQNKTKTVLLKFDNNKLTALNGSQNTSDYESNEYIDSYDEYIDTDESIYTNPPSNEIKQQQFTNEVPSWINTDNSVPPILRSIFKTQTANNQTKRIYFTKSWPSCVKFLTNKNATKEHRLNSHAFLFSKQTPAIIINNEDMPEFDITKLEHSINGFYLSTYLKLSLNTTEKILNKKYQILTTPNILVTWQSVNNSKLNGNLDIIIKFSDSFYYKSILVPFKLNKYYFIEITFDPITASLEVYKNTILISTTNIHSFYDHELFTFSDGLFEIGPINDDYQFIVLDNFKVFSIAKRFLKYTKKISSNITDPPQPTSTPKPLMSINLRGDLKTILKINPINNKNSSDIYKNNVIANNDGSWNEYEYDYQEMDNDRSSDNKNSTSVDETYDTFYIDDLKLLNDTNLSQEFASEDELFQFDGTSAGVSYSSNAKFVTDNDIPNGRKVLQLDGQKNFAKVAFNNFLQDPLRLIDGFTLVAHVKLPRLNVNNMYLMYGNGFEMFTLSKDLIIKYQTDDKEWTNQISNLQENKWYLLNITWDLEQGLKVFVNNELSASDPKPSIIDSVDFLTTDLFIGQPPNDVVANYGELYIDYLVIIPNSKQSSKLANELSKGEPLDARVLQSAPYPDDIIRIDNNINRVMYKIDSPLTSVTSEAIELCFRTNEPNGVVFYIHNNPIISYFEIINGQPLFVIETQHQIIHLRPYVNYRLDDSNWHTIKFQRDGQRLSLQLDKSFDEATIAHANAILTGSSVYLGVADPNNIRLSNKRPFVGHMSRAKVTINNVQQNVRQQPYNNIYGGSVATFQTTNQTVNIDTSQLAQLDGKTINIIINVYGPPGAKPGSNTNVIQTSETQIDTHYIYLDSLPDIRYISVASQDREIDFHAGRVTLDVFVLKFQTRKPTGQLCTLIAEQNNYIGLEVYGGQVYATVSYANKRDRIRISNLRVDDGKIYQVYVKQESRQITCWLDLDENNKQSIIYNNGLDVYINTVRVGGEDTSRFDYRSDGFVGCIGSILLNQRDIIDYKFVQGERRQSCQAVIQIPVTPAPPPPPVVTTTPPPSIDISLGYISFSVPDDLYYFNYVYDSEKPVFNDISFIFQTVSSNGILFTAYELMNNHISNLIGAYIDGGRVHVAFANLTTVVDIPFSDFRYVNNGYIHRLYVRRYSTGEIQAFLQSYTNAQTIEFSTQPTVIRISKLVVGGSDDQSRVKIYGTLPNFVGCILDSFQLNGINILIPRQIPKSRYECSVKPTEPLVPSTTRPIPTTTTTIATKAPESTCYSSCLASECLVEFRGHGYFVYQVQNRYNRDRDQIRFVFRISSEGTFDILTIPYADKNIRFYICDGRLMVKTLYRNTLDTLAISSVKYNDGKWHQVVLEKQYQELIVAIDDSRQYINLGLDFELSGSGQLYFGASNTDDPDYLVGELREIYGKFGNEEYDILASVKDNRIPGAFCQGTVIVRPYVVEQPPKSGFKCVADPSSNQESECHTDGACFAALWRNGTGEVERHMRCFTKEQLQPKENPLLCRYQEDVRFVIKCCYSDYCNRDLDLKLIEISKNDERSIWRFKGPNPGSVQFFPSQQGLIQSQLIFEFNTTQSEGNLLLTRDDTSYLKLDLKGSKLQLSLVNINNRRPTKIIECTSRYSQFSDNKWHKVELVKRNRIITLSCDGGPTQQLQSDVEIPFVNTKYGVRLGSMTLDPKDKGFIGDISLIVYKENDYPYSFDDLQFSEDRRYLYDGYVEFRPKFIIEPVADPKPIRFRTTSSSARLPSWDKLKLSRILFDFKTSSSNQNGQLFSTSKKDHFFAVVLVDGHIEIIISPLQSNPSGNPLDRVQRLFPFPHSRVNDGQWHTFELALDDNVIASVSLDENTNANFRLTKGDYWTEDSDLVFGRNVDIGVNSDLDKSFVGCLRNVLVNNKRIDWSNKGVLNNIEAGCYNDLYRDNYLPFFQNQPSDRTIGFVDFKEDGCLRYNSPSRNSDREKVEFMFKTTDDKSALFYSTASEILIFTQGPSVIIRNSNLNSNFLIVERGIAFNDGNWHKLRVEKRDQKIEITLDNKYTHVLSPNKNSNLGPFYIGCSRGKFNGVAKDLNGQVSNLVYSSTDQSEVDLIDGLSGLNGNILVDNSIVWVPSTSVQEQESKFSPVTLNDSNSYVVLDRASFDRSPNSRISFSFKTNENNGLLTLIQQVGFNDKGNFLAVELVEGKPNLLVNLGNQLRRVECSNEKLNDNKWHSIEIRRDRLGDAGNNNGASSTITFRCDNRYTRFEAIEETVDGQLVIGNPDKVFSRLPSQLWLSRSPKYLGCVKDFVLNERQIDLYQQTTQNSRETIKQGCQDSNLFCRASSKCQNAGTCVEGFSRTYCNCDATSFTGPICETPGKTLLFNGSYGLEFFSENTYTSSAEEIFLRFKTRLRHGLLVSLKNVDNAGLVVAIEDGRIKVVYDCGKHDKASYIGDLNQYNDNKWNALRLKRFGRRVLVEVTDSEKGQKTIVDDLGDSCTQFDYNTVVIGNIQSPRLSGEYPNYIGFIQNLYINNEDFIGYYINNDNKGKWQINGNADIGESTLLLHHQVSFREGCPITLQEVYNNEKFNLHLLFKTSEPNGVIFFRRGRDLFPFMILELSDGSLKFSFDLGTGLTVLKCDSIYNLNDKTWHRVSIRRIENKFVMQVDNAKEISADMLPNGRSLNDLESFVVGGIPQESKYLFKDVANSKNYVGCLASFEINGEVPDLLHESRYICHNELQYGCIDLTCTPNPCNNYGRCSVVTNQLSCNCDLTSYTGAYCQEDSKFFNFGGKFRKCGMVKYKVAPALLSRENDQIAFGFYTSQPEGLLIRIESEKSDQFLDIKLVDGAPVVTVKFENDPQSKVYGGSRKFNDNHYHVLQLTRERTKILIKIDNFAQEEFILQNSGVFASQSVVYAGAVYDSSNTFTNCYYGYLSGMVINTVRILDLGQISGDVIIDVRPTDNTTTVITTPLLPDGTCSLGYRREGDICIFIGCPKFSEFLAKVTCRCLSGYVVLGNECVPAPEPPKKVLSPDSTKLILAPAAGIAETPIGLILGILSGIGLAILGAALAARKCADGACVPSRPYTKVPIQVAKTPVTGAPVAKMIGGTVTNATDTLIRTNEVPIERRDLLANEVINTQHHQEDYYHQQQMDQGAAGASGAATAMDVLDFGYKDQYIAAPIVTQSVNETMEMFEQSTSHRDLGGGYITTSGIATGYGGGMGVSGGMTAGAHHASHRDLAMDSLFYSQNATDYELSNVTCVTMTPNGKYAIVGQSLGSPQIWDTTNGQLIRSMNGTCNNCSNLTLACNGTLLVGLASDGTLPDNQALNLQLWEVQTGRPIQMTHQIKCCVFALSSDTNSIFMAGNQRFGRGISVGILDLVSNELVKEIKSDPNISFGDFPESVVITPDEKHAIVGCKSISGTNFVVFDLTKTTEIAQTRSIALDAEPKCLQVLNNNEVLTGTRGGHIVQWNIHSCKPTVTFVDPNENRAHASIINQILLSPDKEYLASVSSDGTAKVWNANTKQLVSIMTGHQGEVTCVAMSHYPNSDLLITGSTDQTVCLWRLFTGHQVSSMSVGMNLVEVNMARHNKTIVAIGEKDGEQQLLLLKVINVQK